MNSSIIPTTHPPGCTPRPCWRLCTKRFDSSSEFTTLKFKRENDRKSLKCVRSRDSGAKFSPELICRNPSSATSSEAVAERLQRLASEFKSLEEPVERVKRLLDYAARLPPYEESARSAENRVAGCATQVWVEAEMEREEASGRRRMRFRADSDSEISKGFCSCLISVLDGGDAEEVLGLTTEDFEHVNVGLHGKGHSRANTWHNVLLSMQRRTRALVDVEEEEEEKMKLQKNHSLPPGEARVGHSLLSCFPSLLLLLCLCDLSFLYLLFR
ncbi:hypothetical protein TIFTF001_010719 [Ficus carica]|uniref:Fe-S metabolism associated domain-containing protein n=1 Tax=Ficus carica TaxID=3494 RepID=A0AA87ZXH1_FICCA|nr:hypothetical protein TIFTF001_010719 [Ficus carica]